MAPEHEILALDTVPAYIDSKSDLASIVETSILEITEVGDGNLNLVFICKDGNSFLDAWLSQVAEDTIGYGGCKANRRIIGLAKATDIQELPPEEHIKAATMVLRTASTWIRDRKPLGTVATANTVFDRVREEVTGG